MGSSKLSDFLRSEKTRYLEDIKSGNGSRWTVVMGNEAGDLDSAASSIGYAYLQTQTTSEGMHLDSTIVPLIQTAREDIRLRPENVYAFKEASMDSKFEDLLCLNDVPAPPTPFPSARFVLVDHNRLIGRYKSPDDSETVGAVFDHHEDENQHPLASPRMIQVPTGSCASLVVNHFRNSNAWIPEVATLLLSAMVVDTGGLKAGGKATPTDYEAAQFLHSIIFPGSALGQEDLEETFNPPMSELLGRKSDVSHLSNRDLLRRDYKQYQYTSSNPSSSKLSTVSVGLSTVPVDLKEWVPKDPSSISKWMEERDLMIHGSLTSFRGFSKKGKMKHKRQQLWLIREDVPEDLVGLFWKSLEASGDLELEKMKHFEEKLGLNSLGLGESRVGAYKQGNVQATRKVTAPLVKQTIEEYFAGV